MAQQDYNASIVVNATPQEAYDGINNVAKWWTIVCEGSSAHENDVFTVRFGETFITVTIGELIPGQSITWHVTDCNKHWLKDKKEWRGTTMIWELSAIGDRTQINFMHKGLVPGLECYGGCSQAWGFYLKESLFKLLNEGKGVPELK